MFVVTRDRSSWTMFEKLSNVRRNRWIHTIHWCNHNHHCHNDEIRMVMDRHRIHRLHHPQRSQIEPRIQISKQINMHYTHTRIHTTWINETISIIYRFLCDSWTNWNTFVGKLLLDLMSPGYLNYHTFSLYFSFLCLV